MRHSKRLRIALTALLLTASPWHAQIAYACSTMNATVHDCCCGSAAREPCATPHATRVADPAEPPCCETSIELGAGQATDAAMQLPAALATKPAVKQEPVPDAPPALAPVPAQIAAAPAPVAVRTGAKPTTPPHAAGSKTYLATQRLRI